MNNKVIKHIQNEITRVGADVKGVFSNSNSANGQQGVWFLDPGTKYSGSKIYRRKFTDPSTFNYFHSIWGCMRVEFPYASEEPNIVYEIKGV